MGADDVPGQYPEQVLNGMRARERGQAAGNVRVTQMLAEVRARRQAQQPDATDSFGAQTFAQDGVARASLLRWRNLSAIQRLLNLAQDGRFHAGAQRGSDDAGVDVNFGEMGSEQHCARKNWEKRWAGVGGNVDESGTHLSQVLFKIRVGCFGGLRFEA